MRARKKGDMYLGKVSNYINQNMAKFKQIYIRYVASIFCVFIIAVVSIIANQKKGFDIESIVTVCSIWLAGNFLVESLWKKTAEEAQKNSEIQTEENSTKVNLSKENTADTATE